MKALKSGVNVYYSVPDGFDYGKYKDYGSDRPYYHKGIALYRKEKGKTTWKYIDFAVVDGTSGILFDATAKAGKVYYYKTRLEVRFCHPDNDPKDADIEAVSEYSKPRKFTVSAAPVIQKIDQTYQGAEITWTKANGAKKYQVFRKTLNGKKWKSIGKTKRNSFVDTTARSDTAYVYMVRSINKKGKTITTVEDSLGFIKPVALTELDNYSYFARRMSQEQLQESYDVMAQILGRVRYSRRVSRLSDAEKAWVAYNVTYQIYHQYCEYSMSEPHYDDTYGFFINHVVSCAGVAMASGMCLNALGLPYEHVHLLEYRHQWARVKIGNEYWIVDGQGGYCGPEDETDWYDY